MTTEAQRARNARKRAKLKAHRREARQMDMNLKRSWSVYAQDDMEIPVINSGDFARWEIAVYGDKVAKPQFEEAELLGEDNHAEWFTTSISCIEVGVYANRGTPLADIKKEAKAYVEENYGFGHNDVVAVCVAIKPMPHLLRHIYLGDN